MSKVESPFLERCRLARTRFFEYRHGAGVIEKAALAVGLAALTGVAAQVRVPLPFTPVPVTLQTFTVLLAGVALGARWGGASQAVYVGGGAAGIPWFTGTAGGVGAVLGPTGGYLVGFVLAAGFTGYVTDRWVHTRRLVPLVGVMLVANALVYAVGLPWLFGWLTLIGGQSLGIAELLTMGLVPFVAGDVVKLLGAAAIGRTVRPPESVVER